MDERDGLSLQTIKADYITVADPVSFHLPPEHQRIVSYVAESLLNGTGLGEDFEKLPIQFDLAKGHKGYIYKRVKPLSEDNDQKN